MSEQNQKQIEHDWKLRKYEVSISVDRVVGQKLGFSITDTKVGGTLKVFMTDRLAEELGAKLKKVASEGGGVWKDED